MGTLTDSLKYIILETKKVTETRRNQEIW